MKIDRRKFLKMAGLAGVGMGLSGVELIKPGTIEASSAHSVPSSGTRLAMVIDTRRSWRDEDYQRVTEACHSIHNVPDIGNPKDEVKWIWTDTYNHTFPDQKNDYLPQEMIEKRFLLLCNHCDNPPCVRVCPTQATFKRKSDGVVIQDPHRCIGCRFCMAACPYGSRSFNWVDPRGKDKNDRPFIKERNYDFPTRTMGVVEKCTFCVERLAKDLEPACVEASNGAMVFGNLADPDSEVRKILNRSFTLRRKPTLGTLPSVFYIIGGDDYAG